MRPKCSGKGDVYGINDIPRHLSYGVGFLSISNTNVSIVNLTATGDYPAVCGLEIDSSPVRTIVIPYPLQTVALTTFVLDSEYSSTLSNLVFVLAEQLRYLTFNVIRLVTIPDNYFRSYTRLITISPSSNPIFDLTESMRLVWVKHTSRSSTTTTPVAWCYSG